MSGLGAGSEPLVSVVMIFLDAEPFISDAVASVRQQTYRNWELLLIDDGSRDGSTGLAKAWAREDPQRIRYVEHEGHANLGTGPSRNAGMAHARGALIAFLDADDVYLPERLARHVSTFRLHDDIGMVISRELYWRTWQGPATTILGEDEVVGPHAARGSAMAGSDLLLATLATPGAAVPATCSITFRSELAFAIDDRFTDQYEDQVLYAGMLLSCCVFLLDDCLALYRQHDRSLTHVARVRGEYRPDRAHDVRSRYLAWLKLRVATLQPGNAALLAAIDRQLLPERYPRWNFVHEWLQDAGKTLRRAAHALARRILPPHVADALARRYLARRQRRILRRALRVASSAQGKVPR